ncbi:hypothetical protein AMECASPLE_029225 [Ameca splendens]|uniref:Uncharacterized protein n=1 Tax=Ameca splendens TaxID=208324 RepID=A0ABV0XIQ2_9TELE
MGRRISVLLESSRNEPGASQRNFWLLGKPDAGSSPLRKLFHHLMDTTTLCPTCERAAVNRCGAPAVCQAATALQLRQPASRHS